ncbi:MAG: nicotinate-nucleotide--dimethylbenzimidazole phosphoribosyltransferase [Acidaminococcaceae bacterium]|nr:nicotinate-nucleotide--dimethylbenzimidazole phosphoribosyltransferase [Acidaminococcaceae bacterium]
MEFNEYCREIHPLNKEVAEQAQKHFDNLIKPLGSLGKLEKMVCLYAGAKESAKPEKLNFPKRMIMLWSEENELAPQVNSPINILTQTANGTVVREIVKTNRDDLKQSIKQGITATEQVIVSGCELLAPVTCGRYTLPSGWERLKERDWEEILYTLGSEVCAAMVGSILCAAKHRVPIMLDGLASVLAACIAGKICPEALEYCICSQITTERGQEELAFALGFTPVLRLHIRQGNGYGAALAFTLFDAGLKAYKEMKTFAETGVHDEVSEFAHSKQVRSKQR